MRASIGMVLLVALAASSQAGMIELRIDENDPAVDGVGQFAWNEPLNAGDPVWFDVRISSGLGESAEGIQITLTVEPVGHSGTLAFSPGLSTAVANNPQYWIFGNSVGANALDLGANRYQFGDGPDNPPSALLADDTIVARFSFLWDGTVGNYRVRVDSSIQNTFVLQNFVPQPPSWSADPVILHVPEPSTALGYVPVVICMLRFYRRTC